MSRGRFIVDEEEKKFGRAELLLYGGAVARAHSQPFSGNVSASIKPKFSDFSKILCTISMVTIIRISFLSIC